MKKLIVFLVLFSLAFTGLAQQSDYKLNFKRDFGYGSGSQVRGKFSLSVVGNLENVEQVSYRIDGQEIALVSAAPFRFSFQTDTYGIGWHELSAEITLAGGSLAATPVRRFEFVSQEDEMAGVSKIIIPIGGLALLITLLGVGGQFLSLRGKNSLLAPGTARNYGLRGGTICKRCNRPFPIHWWAMNLALWRLDRCDYCGHVALVQRCPTDVLRAAEAAEKEAFREGSGSIPAGPALLSPEEQLRRQLDESRYTDK